MIRRTTRSQRTDTLFPDRTRVRANEDYFDCVAACDLNVEGGEINGPLQIGAPVSPDVGAPGDEVYFFQLQELPIGENGELVETWVMLDNGTIDANGVARTNSPPFPGLNKNGQIMIVRASQPMQQVRSEERSVGKGCVW